MGLTNFPDRELMKRFLYGELPEEEAQALEERIFVDNNLFYEINSFENELTDEYVQGKLKGEELARFEQSLVRSDERREQVKNARALQRYITEQKKSLAPAAAAETPRQPIWSLLSGLFSIRAPAVQYAAAILLAVLVVGGVWLLYQGYKLHQELAQARGEQGDMKNKVAETEQQYEILRRTVNEQREKNEELNAALKQLEEKLAQVNREPPPGSRNQTSAPPTPPDITPINVMGGADVKVVRYNRRQVTVRLLLPTTTDYQTYKIEENGKLLVGPEDIKKVTDAKSGETYLEVKLPARSMVFSVIGRDPERGREQGLGDYRLEMKKKR